MKKNETPINMASTFVERAITVQTLEPLLNRSIKITIVLGLAILITLISLVISIFFLFQYESEVQYLMQDRNGRIIDELRISDRPFKNRNDVTNRVDDCIRDSFSLTYKRYREEVSDTRSCYTKKGLNELVASLDNHGVIRKLTLTQNITTLIPDTAPLVEIQTDKSIAYEAKYLLEYETTGKDQQVRRRFNNISIYANVIEVPRANSTYGFQINSINIKVSDA